MTDEDLARWRLFPMESWPVDVLQAEVRYWRDEASRLNEHRASVLAENLRLREIARRLAGMEACTFADLPHEIFLRLTDGGNVLYVREQARALLAKK